MVVDSNISLLVFAVVGLLIPFAVDLVTKQLASVALKQTALLALSLISGVLVEFINSGAAFDWHVAAIGALTAFVTGVATIKGLDGTKALGRNSVLSNPTSGFGIGKEQPVISAPPVVADPESDGV